MPHADADARQKYNREYKRANRHRFRLSTKIWDACRHANERATKAGSSGVLTLAETAEILHGAGACNWCGVELAIFHRTLDHVVPLADGGANRPENVVVACGTCNAHKWAKPSIQHWARHHACCVRCGTTERRHAARGLCARCYGALFVDPGRGRRRLTDADRCLLADLDKALFTLRPPKDRI